MVGGDRPPTRQRLGMRLAASARPPGLLGDPWPRGHAVSAPLFRCTLWPVLTSVRCCGGGLPSPLAPSGLG